MAKLKLDYETLLDAEMAQQIDLTYLSPEYKYFTIWKRAKQVSEYNFRSLCIPSYYLETFRCSKPDIKISTVANFPYGYHNSDVLIREMQGIQALCVDLGYPQSMIEIDAVMPSDIHTNWDFVAQINHLTPIKFILAKHLINHQIELLPTLYKPFEIVKIGTGFDGETNFNTVKPYIDKIKAKGYKVKIAGGIKTHFQARQLLDYGVDILGASKGLELLTYNQKVLPDVIPS